METVGQKAAVGPSGLAKPTMNFKRLLSDWGPVVLLTLGSLWLIQGALARTAWHGVIVQGADYDAGTVKVGSVVTHSFHLINLSSQPVTVNAQPGCGCTVVDVPEKPLAPLHSEQVKAQVDVEGSGKGLQHKGIFLALHSGNASWRQVAVISFRLY